MRVYSQRGFRFVLNDRQYDLLYVDDLTDDETIVCLLRRYLDQKYFTYFGNVLFYIQPLDRDPLREYSNFIYSTSSESHLFPFLKELFIRTISTAEAMQTNTNFNVFFYGDNNFGQLRATQTSLVFLVQFVHSLGLEVGFRLNKDVQPTGLFNTKVSNAFKILENMSDYNSNSRLSNYMVTYKMNFDDKNELKSITMSPNFSTDLSCCVVSYSFREFLLRNVTPFYPKLNLRFPSLFYGVLQSLARGHNSQWFSDCKITRDCAIKALELLPTHEVRDSNYHVLNFAKMMDLFLMIGFTVDEVKYIINILSSIVMLDHKHTEEVRKRIIFAGVDLLDLILDLLQIDLLNKSDSELKYNDILFKFEILSNARSRKFDTLSSAIYLRLKHLVYLKLNTYLSVDSNGITKSLCLHCNFGSNPYAQFIKFSDYHLPWHLSEEFFMNKMFKTIMNDLKGPPYLEFVARNLALVDSATSREGLLSRIILETVRSNNESTMPDFDGTGVSHSWHDMTYNIPNVLKIESTLYSISPMIKTLLKYSKNQFLSMMLFSNRSLHQSLGNCASALSYYFYLNDTDYDTSYYVVCSTPVDFKKSNYQDRFNLMNFNGTANILYNSFTRKLPLLEICNARRTLDVHIVPVVEYMRQNVSLVYMLTSKEHHRSIPHLKEEQLAQLLFSLLSVPESMYRISHGVLTMKKTLYIKILTLLDDYLKRHTETIVFIQRWWKDHRMPMVRKRLVKLVTRVQSLARMENARKEARLAKQGKDNALAFVGLVATLFRLNNCLNTTSTKTRQLLHHMEKQFHEKEYEYLQQSAATYIQAMWRGAIERKKYSLVKQNRFEEFAIVFIQSSVRRILASSQILNVRNTKTISATMIQSYFRGYLARKNMGDQINFIKLYKDYDSVSLQMKRLISVQTNLPPGFIKVQNLVRMHFVRRQFLHLKNCLEKVQALGMTKDARLSYLEKVRAALKIQRWWRCRNKDSFPAISTNPIYYINTKEQASLAVLAKELKNLGVHVFHFSVYQDIRRIYPNSWALMPLCFVKNIKLMQRSSADLNYTQIRKIEYVKFAVGSTHSLMLISTKNGSCVYSWGWNDKGQLGRRNLYPLQPSDKDFMQMEPLEFEDEYRDKLYEGISDRINIEEIACGNDFSVALSSRGRVFTWGDNSLGQCGHGRRLMRVHDPRPLDFVGVDFICCASLHTVISVSGEYYVFGNAFERLIFRPVNVKTLVPHLRNQTIKKVRCAGSTTLLYTEELDYVLNVFSQLHSFQSMYNLKGSIKSFCTNGKMVCAAVEIWRGEDQNAETNVYVLGQVRCVVSQEKNTFASKSLFVGAFKEKFENLGKKKTKHSWLDVHSTHGSTCFLEHPTEVLLPREPIDVFCDQQQLIFTTNAGVYATRVFQVLSESSSDFEILDNCTIDIKQGANIRLEPSLYQFTNIAKKRPTIYLSSNSLSHSIGYTF
ncbi:uncharacterized protein TOT_020000400 [Theileria orientalis strain Shintoku]|uniref:Uncharacterized protein n=1 Tax=Theileria orientalis strain Shintoku TaxID=869250 RepID=J4CCX2_THEOR|nr:uncharacterized protein TOT_020000400 [Theileria orientalis strain Shintoku]BAM40137.1 uncharacterized protein TOT_020000400 [Theileria orientalis strain Shintoku]|eukprot:XP_009690438.1 uncharacterized protein TOT_020000400 [Theileria orientalis strain Shintoku]